MPQRNLKIRVRIAGDEPPPQNLQEAPYEMRAPERMVISSTPRSSSRYLVTSLVVIAMIAAASAFAIYRILSGGPEIREQAAGGPESVVGIELAPPENESMTASTPLEIPLTPAAGTPERETTPAVSDEAESGGEIGLVSGDQDVPVATEDSYPESVALQIPSREPEPQTLSEPDPVESAAETSADATTPPPLAGDVTASYTDEPEILDPAPPLDTVGDSEETAIEVVSTTTEAASTAPETAASASESEHIARAVLTSGIKNREPVDTIGPNIVPLESTARQVYLFTEFRDLEGQTVSHRWEYEGDIVATVDFRIGGDRWRVYSSKLLPPHMTGEWRVTVVDSDGGQLGTYPFLYE